MNENNRRTKKEIDRLQTVAIVFATLSLIAGLSALLNVIFN